MESKAAKILLASIVGIAAYSIFLVVFLNRDYPLIGHDYSYFVPRLIDTYIHYRVNGLSVQWYTPSFGGGLPAFANSQNIQYSVPQFLVSFVNPWLAVLSSIIGFVLAGFLFSYLFFRQTLRFDWTASLLGAYLFVVNGFFIQHLMVGHLGYLTFPLLAVIVYSFFKRNRGFLLESILISLCAAATIYNAGFYLILVFILSLIIIAAILHILIPDVFEWRILGRRMILSILLILGISGGKIYAVYSFMRFFPRVISIPLHTTWLKGLWAIVGQLLGTMTFAPYYWLTQKNLSPLNQDFHRWIGVDYLGLWEYDMSVSPVLWIFLGIGALLLLVQPRAVFGRIKQYRFIPFVVLLISLWSLISMILTKGHVYALVKNMPIFSSLHVTLRFTSALIFPLVVLGMLGYHTVVMRLDEKWRQMFLCIFGGMVSLFLFSYFPLPRDMIVTGFNVQESLNIYRSIRNGNIPQVKEVADVPDWQTFELNASSIEPYEPTFGYFLEAFHPETVIGPVTHVENGFFNMNNPAGFVYPEINSTRPFERIRTSEAERLLQFIDYKQPNWEIPHFQLLLNAISVIIIAIELLFVVISIFNKVMSKRQARTIRFG